MKSKYFLSVLFSLCVLLQSIQAQTSSKSKPNVLLIAIDDMNDWAGFLGGHPDAQTPNIDKLSKRGTAFHNAHCQAPICNPSRTSIMYGLRPSSTGIYGNWPFPWQAPGFKSKKTLSRWFAQNGYLTLTTGKIYHASKFPPQDFDVDGPRPRQAIELDQKIVKDIEAFTPLWDFGPQEYDEDKFIDKVCANWAIERLDDMPQDKPFFLAVGFFRPHVPFYSPRRVYDSFNLDDIDLPPYKEDDLNDISQTAKKLTYIEKPPAHSWFIKNKRWQETVKSYIAAMKWTDEQVGRVLEALDKSPFADNTIIVLYSDHGFHLGEKSRWAKWSLWERSTRVPFMIITPGLASGQKVNKPVELLSIYPTLIELCGLSKNPDIEGRSLVPLLQNQNADWPYHAVTTFMQNNHSVRSENYRYIRYHDGSEELYNNQIDPNEWKNLLADGISEEEMEIIKTLKKSLPQKNIKELRRAGK